MSYSLDMINSYTGLKFEDDCVELLKACGFKAVKTGKDDKGVDIIASISINETVKKYYIQCKYHNKTLGYNPIQEIFSGTHCYGADGDPVLITNNNVSSKTRRFAKVLGVEIISAPEWREIKEANHNKTIINPNRHGLAGVIIGKLCDNQEFVAQNIQISAVKAEKKDELTVKVTDDFDRILEYRTEANRLRQQALQLEQRADAIQREEMFKLLGFL